MNSDLYIVGGGSGAPVDPQGNRQFHQEIIDTLIDHARQRGWAGGKICGYDRFEGRVACNLAPAPEGWPDLETLRAWREANRGAEPLLSRPKPVDQDGQGSLL